MDVFIYFLNLLIVTWWICSKNEFFFFFFFLHTVVAYHFSASKENALFQIFIGVKCFKGSWLNQSINQSINHQLKCFMLNYISNVLCCSFTMIWDRMPQSRLHWWEYGKADLRYVAESEQQEIALFMGFLWVHLAGEYRVALSCAI